jgi:hypothetical protein
LLANKVFFAAFFDALEKALLLLFAGDVQKEPSDHDAVAGQVAGGLGSYCFVPPFSQFHLSNFWVSVKRFPSEITGSTPSLGSISPSGIQPSFFPKKSTPKSLENLRSR